MQSPPVPASKWYDQTWLIALLCVVFFPVGLYGLWKNRSIGKGWKIAVTCFWGIIVLAAVSGDPKKPEAATAQAKEEADAPAPVVPEMTQAQKDSLAHIAKVKALQARKDKTIDAASLIASYDANEVKADDNFKGKSFFVEGTVEQIAKDFTDDIYVILEGDGFLSNVHCYVGDKKAAAELQKGQTATLYGTCEGLVIGSVMMKGCEIKTNIADLEAELQ